MNRHMDEDGWRIIEDRSYNPGSGLKIAGTGTLIGHPVDVYRRLWPDVTEPMSDLEVLELWHNDEVDRRLEAAGMPAPLYLELSPSLERFIETLDSIDLDVLRMRVRAMYGLPVYDTTRSVLTIGTGL